MTISRELAFETAPAWLRHSAEVVASAQVNVIPGSERWKRVRNAAALELLKAFEEGHRTAMNEEPVLQGLRLRKQLVAAP